MALKFTRSSLGRVSKGFFHGYAEIREGWVIKLHLSMVKSSKIIFLIEDTIPQQEDEAYSILRTIVLFTDFSRSAKFGIEHLGSRNSDS